MSRLSINEQNSSIIIEDKEKIFCYTPSEKQKHLKYYSIADTEEIEDIETILSELNKAIDIDMRYVSLNENKIREKYQYQNECEEILSILKKPLSDKNISNNPFKILTKPKKISLVGRVFSDIPSDDTKNSANFSNSKSM